MPDFISIRPFTDDKSRYRDVHKDESFQRQQAALNIEEAVTALGSSIDDGNTLNSRLPSLAGTGTTSIKKINKALSRRQVPELVEEELEEQFVRGAVLSPVLFGRTEEYD